MQSFKHPNVMSLIGVCKNLSGGPAVVMPFMANGSVLHYLKKNRKNLVLDAKAEETMVYSLHTVKCNEWKVLAYQTSRLLCVTTVNLMRFIVKSTGNRSFQHNILFLCGMSKLHTQ